VLFIHRISIIVEYRCINQRYSTMIYTLFVSVSLFNKLIILVTVKNFTFITIYFYYCEQEDELLKDFKVKKLFDR
jgi:hypothetical protein